MNGPVSIRVSDYEYLVELGTVSGKESISWHLRTYCKEWDDVATLVEAWEDARDHPAVEVEAAYRPIDRDSPGAV